MEDKRIAKSYVWHKDQCYFISTIENAAHEDSGTPSLVWRISRGSRVCTITD